MDARQFSDCSAPDRASDSAWQPGVLPGIPRAYRALETIVSPAASFSTLEEIDEHDDLTGLGGETLTRFRPLRLALHETIVRVTADLAVAEGDAEEQFGHNFRAIARVIQDGYVAPRAGEIDALWHKVHTAAQSLADDILGRTLFAPMPPMARRSWRDVLRRRPAPPSPVADDPVAAFRRDGLSSEDPLARAVFRALYRILGAIVVRRGRPCADRALLVRLAAADVANRLGGQRIGEVVDQAVAAALAKEQFTRVPIAAKPVLISLKGASAAGKSSLRPMIKRILREQGIAPDGYATISPDVWRRLLLDYESLGAAYKYAGHLTSRELMAIDGKLDRYIRAKAQRHHGIPHLVVDRFRFDSFESEKVARVLHDTYAKYVDTLLMYFVVTPPEETVERGWRRALERGRYKAVEDFLGHGVEAYVGMPKILFKWLSHPRPHYRYCFLDNRVPKGEFPKTIARGDQHQIDIFDPVGLTDIVRYQHINIHADAPERVYPPHIDHSVTANDGFLRELLRRIPTARFLDPASDRPYASADRGVLRMDDPALLAAQPSDVLRLIEKMLRDRDS
jgi:hypothetical protein